LRSARQFTFDHYSTGDRDRHNELAAAAAEKLTAGGAHVVLIPLDVTSDASVADAVRRVREHTDRLDVLINNAGAPGRLIAPVDATVREIHSVYDTNVYGPIRVTPAFLPLLQAAEHPRVVMVSSGGGSFEVVTGPDQPVSKMHELAYSSSKRMEVRRPRWSGWAGMETTCSSRRPLGGGRKGTSGGIRG
jgi:NAD(P)-dependent dehydrogenase (short-subunit alcohol dehydrogenase family)